MLYLIVIIQHQSQSFRTFAAAILSNISSKSWFYFKCVTCINPGNI